MKTFAIVVVCYNRLPGVKRLIKSVEKINFAGRKDITLIFSIDNSGTKTVEKFATEYNWEYGEKIVRTFPERQGLKKHILQCGDYTSKYDVVVILEDDLMVSDSMYNYAIQAAEKYWYDDNIAGISLYSFQKNWLKWLLRFEPQKTIYDAYFLKVAMSWGQVWIKPKWEKFKNWLELNPEFCKSDRIPSALNDWPESSWLKFHDLFCIDTNRYFVYPYVSLSTNCSDPGEHAKYTVTDHQVELMYGKNEYNLPDFNDDSVIYDEFMEREKLGKYLGIQDVDLTVDIWGNKPKQYYKRYVLTPEDLPYKVIDSFSLSLRPVELSIITSLEGKDIKLYDTEQHEARSKHNNTDFIRYKYSIRSNDYRTLLLFSMRLSMQFFSDLNRKIKKVFRIKKNK